MSLADHIFMDMCRDILENGTDTKGEKVQIGRASCRERVCGMV